MSALALLAMFSGCATMFWNPDVYHTGRVLDEGQKLASCGTFLIVPTTAGFSYGISDGWELSGRAGCFGTYDTAYRRDGSDPSDFPFILARHSLTEVGLGVHRSLLRSAPFYAAASADLAGFVTDFNPISPLVYGAKLTVGATPSFYPVDWFGIYLPLQLMLLTADDGNRQFNFYPSLGLTFDRGWFGFRLAYGGGLIRIQRKDVGGDRTLQPVPTLGLMCGVRW